MTALHLFAFGVLFQQLAGSPQAPREASSPRPPAVALEVKSTVDVPSMGDPALILPVVCAEDQSILFRTNMLGTVSDVVAITPEGKQKAVYRISQVSDVTQPKALTFFPRGKFLYLLVRGYKGTGERRTLRRPDGSTESQVTYETPTFYIAKFEENGAYRGAVELEVPFRPLQFGVFENGDFLVAGATQDLVQTRIAMVRSNGQFVKFIELTGDVHLKSSAADDEKSALPESGKRFGDSLRDVLQTSKITADGGRLLLVRKGTAAPIFAFTSGAEVKPVNLDVPSGYRIDEIKTTGDFWIGVFTRRMAEGGGVEFAINAIDPESGKTLNTYGYPRFPGFGFACSNGREFSFLTNSDQKLKILTLQPTQHYSSVEKNSATTH